MAAAEGFLTSVYALDDVTRPTFFELVAQAQLMAALRPAVRFVVGVYADRAPSLLLPLLARWEALFGVLVLLLETYHLRAHGALFAEHFYGLRRQEAAPRRKLSMLEAVELERRRQAAPTLGPRQQLASLAAAVLLPLARLRCEACFREAEGLPPRLRSLRQWCWVRLYPWAHAAGGGLALVYQVLYLLRQSDFWSPTLHLLRLRVVRHLPEPPQPDAPDKSRLLRLWDAAGTAGSMSLWGLMYFLQFLQWWYQREHLLQPFQPRKVPPPPPARPPYRDSPLPPALPAAGAAEGATGPRLVLLPQDRTVCPLCHRARRNPAMSSGGYVFCYTCLVPHVQRHGRCPVTGLAMEPEQVRRIRDESDDA